MFPALADWQRAATPPTSETIVDLAICVHKPDCFYAATAHGLFQNENSKWQSVFRFTAFDDAIERMYASEHSPFLWIQTHRSIYRFDPINKKSTRIYETSDVEKFPTAFYAGEKTLWLGTSFGIWNSQDSGKSWQKRSDLADHLPVHLIAGIGSEIYFSAGGEWRRIENDRPRTLFKLFAFENAAEAGENFEIEETEASPAIQTFFDFSVGGGNYFLATQKGVYQSTDGIVWQPLSNSGLRSTATLRLLYDSNSNALMVLAQDGVFVWNAEKARWSAQNDGLAKLDLRALSLVGGKYFAANSEGLWQWQEPVTTTTSDPEKVALFHKLIALEPSARMIHKRVIRYSDTSNAKIKRWHAESRAAALLPSLSFGKDMSSANNIDLDRAGTNDPDRFIEGPRDKDRNVSVDLSWDLGDFIFSTSQTSIDSRAKLNVDLRNDLLAEATRLYFERRRLQAEIIATPATDEKTHLDNLLRLEELTALIDALTDGFLSRKLERIYERHPELGQLWRLEAKGLDARASGLENEGDLWKK